ncbi:hypothetical protein LDENG_00073360 [Lucifuga dentata]|nr:hypothetical protein LDENG_00073360 [Lucifuga dentata]
MVRLCCVKSCNNKSHDGKGIKVDHDARFFRFSTWIKAIWTTSRGHNKEASDGLGCSGVRRKNITSHRQDISLPVCLLPAFS